jgi:hypothetical protein
MAKQTKPKKIGRPKLPKGEAKGADRAGAFQCGRSSAHYGSGKR